MNIALFTDTYLPEVNGVATSVATLYKTLVDHGENVCVITSNPFNKKTTIDGNIIRMPGIRLSFLYNYIFTSFYSRKIFKILKQHNIDVVHVHADLNVSLFGRIVGKKLHVPVVYTYHTMYEDYTSYATKGKVDRFAKYAVRQYTDAVCDDASCLIVPSLKTKDYLRRIGVHKYIHIVPTGLDISRFNFKPEFDAQKQELEKQLGIAANSKIFLSLGRIGEEKSVDITIKYFIRYIEDKKVENIHLLVVGDGPAKKGLEQIVKENKAERLIHFLGKVDPSETPFYYNICDLYISSSTTETQGLTYIEAMACKKPCLAKYDYNLSGLINDNINGYFFRDYEQFSQKIDKFLNLTSTYIVELQEEIFSTVNYFSLDNFYKGIMEVYSDAIRKLI